MFTYNTACSQWTLLLLPGDLCALTSLKVQCHVLDVEMLGASGYSAVRKLLPPQVLLVPSAGPVRTWGTGGSL